MNDQDDLIQTFIEEARDISQRILDDLSGFLDAADKESRFNSIMRGIHTIKGGAASCGILDLKEEAHQLETELLAFKAKPETIDSEQIQRVLKALDNFDTFLGDPTTKYSDQPHLHDEGFVLFDDGAPSTGLKETADNAKKIPSASSGLVRVPLDRIQKNMDSIGEIFLTRNQLRHLLEQHQVGQLQEDDFFRQWELLDNRLRQNIRDLEYNAMAMRLTSVKALLRRMEKTVRSYTGECDKEIQVELVGEDIELDKLIVDSLAEPLVHLVRNAMDHGIESKEERQQKSKPPVALIRIEISTAGNEAHIKVSDDGRGIDPQKVLASAKRKGLAVDGIKTKEDMLNLIFLPGFSTKEAVSEVSGRGIGMDAVKTCIEGLGGSTTVTTEADAGTLFTLKLPLGLSVVPAFIALIHGHKIALSTTDIIETIKAPRSSIVRNAHEALYCRKDHFIPCITLDDHIFFNHQPKRILNRNPTVSLCIIDSPRGLVAVQIENLVANVEIALKAMPPHSANLAYATGVSVLATGEAVFVISLSRLCEHVRTQKINFGQEDKHDNAA